MSLNIYLEELAIRYVNDSFHIYIHNYSMLFVEK